MSSIRDVYRSYYLDINCKLVCKKCEYLTNNWLKRKRTKNVSRREIITDHTDTVHVYYLLIVSRVPFYRGMFQKLAFSVFRDFSPRVYAPTCKEGCQIYRKIKLFSQVSGEKASLKVHSGFDEKNVNKKYNKMHISFPIQ